MKEKILALLSEKFKGARKDGLELMANTLAMVAADDENAKKMVEGMTEDQVKEFISNHRKSADAEISKATKTAEENLRKKYNFVEKTDGDPKKTEEGEQSKGGEQQPDIKKLIEEAIAPYKAKIDSFEQGNIKATRRGKFDEVTKNVYESVRKLMSDNFDLKTFESEEDFTKYLDEVKAQAENYEKEFKAYGLRNLGAPDRATGNADGVSAAAKAYIEKKHKQQSN